MSRSADTIHHDDRSTSPTDDDTVVGVPNHPVATGVGALLGGAATGAVAGAAGGPIGAVVGAAVGAVIGGLGGDAVAESFEESNESTYWREHYASRPYVNAGDTYEDYEAAYAHGFNARRQYPGRSFEELEPELSSGWSKARRDSKLDWDQARNPTRDAWALTPL